MIIVSSDGIQFDVSRDVADLSDFLRNADQEDEIVVPNVHARELEIVIRFCDMHVREPMQNIPTPLNSLDLSEYIQPQYMSFLDSIDVRSDLVPLILAADFLGVEPIVGLLCAKMAIIARTSDNVDAFLTQFHPALLSV